MIDQDSVTFDTITFDGELGHIEQGEALFHDTSFTRSDGTIFSRIYERLTKQSRRRTAAMPHQRTARKEQAYREGVLDTLLALRAELS